MPPPKRPRRAPTDDWEQLRLFVGWPEQETYEMLRPIVLFGQTTAARAEVVGVSERTLDRKADRFDAAGMASLFDTAERAPDDRRLLPADIRRRILALKAEYPAFRPHEIAEICRRRDDCRVSHKTVQRVLETEPLPSAVTRRYPPYAQMPDGQQRRLAIVHLYFDGWNVKSIAGYLPASHGSIMTWGRATAPTTSSSSVHTVWSAWRATTSSPRTRCAVNCWSVSRTCGACWRRFP
jgi:transposase